MAEVVILDSVKFKMGDFVELTEGTYQGQRGVLITEHADGTFVVELISSLVVTGLHARSLKVVPRERGLDKLRATLLTNIFDPDAKWTPANAIIVQPSRGDLPTPPDLMIKAASYDEGFNDGYMIGFSEATDKISKMVEQRFGDKK